MQPHQYLRRCAPSPLLASAQQRADDAVEVRIQRSRRRRDRDQFARRIGADAFEELVARDGRARREVAIPVRRSTHADLLRRVAVKLHRLLLHDLVPDNQRVGASDGDELVREVVPARIDDDRPHAAADGGAKQRHLREDQAGARSDKHHGMIPIEQLLGPRMRDRPVDDVVTRRLAENRRGKHAGQQALGANPSDRLLRPRLFAANLDRLADAGIEIARLDERHQPALKSGRLMRRQVLERHARPLKLLHERRVLHER